MHLTDHQMPIQNAPCSPLKLHISYPGNRTHDLDIANAVLNQLSHRKAPEADRTISDVRRPIHTHQLKTQHTVINQNTVAKIPMFLHSPHSVMRMSAK